MRVLFTILGLIFYQLLSAQQQCVICPIVQTTVPNGDMETTSEPVCSSGSTNGNLFFDASPLENWVGVTNSNNIVPNVTINGMPANVNTPNLLTANCANTGNTNVSCGSGEVSVGLWTAFISSLGASATYAGEFVQVKFDEPLTAGKEYCMSFSLRSTDFQSPFGGLIAFEGSDGFGFYLSEDSTYIATSTNPSNSNIGVAGTVSINAGGITTQQSVDFGASNVNNTNELLNLTPTWEIPTGDIIPYECTEYVVNFCAAGGERWVTFGNFKPYADVIFDGSSGDANPNAYTILDNVSLKLIDTLGTSITAPSASINCGDCVELSLNLECTQNILSINWGSDLPIDVMSVNVCPEDNQSYNVAVTYESNCVNQTETTSFDVEVNPVFLDPVTLADATICDGESITLDATSSAGATYEWSTGTTTASIEVMETGDYTVTITEENGCDQLIEMAFVLVEEAVLEPVTLPANTTICEGESISLDATSSTDATYIWNTGESTASVEVLQTGDYTVTITSGNGCAQFIETASVLVEQCECPLFIPDAFSPNNDGTNDAFEILCIDEYENEILIFNRWGQTVFNAVNYDGTWDGMNKGKPLPDASYYYILNVTDQDGVSDIVKGSVLIIR